MTNNKKPKKVIAIIGMAGSGKTEAIEYLQKKYKWPKVYFAEAVFDQMKKENLEINPANEQYMRKKIREKFGMGVCAKFSIPKINKALTTNDLVLAESLYSWDEYKIIKIEYGDKFKVVAINAASDIRFSRLKKRKIRPLKTFKEFLMRDWHEIEATDKGGPIAIADYTIINEGDLSELHRNIDKVIKKII